MAKIIIKSGTNNPGTKLDQAEPGYDKTEKRLYVGNGVGVQATAIPNKADLDKNYPEIIDLTV